MSVVLAVNDIIKATQFYTFIVARALWNLYIVHSPTNALFIKLGKV
jgi:hypothetical protein